MTDKEIIIGRMMNITGMVGVVSGIFLFVFGIVLLIFRHGFGFNITDSFRWFW